MGWVTVHPFPSADGHEQIYGGAGTPAFLLSARTCYLMAACGHGRSILGVSAGNYNPGDLKLMKASLGHLKGIPFWFPSRALPGCPNGFNGDPDKVDKYRDKVDADILRSMQDLHRVSAGFGSKGGQVFQFVTDGGHLKLNQVYVDVMQSEFPDAQHLGYYNLPTSERHNWDNLRNAPDLPDDLGIPLVVSDNRYKVRIDTAIPWKTVLLTTAREVTCQTQRSIVEVFADMIKESKMLGMAIASIDIPYVPLKILTKLGRYVRGQEINVMPEQELPSHIHRLLAKVFYPEAKLIACPEPDPALRQVVVIGGVPLPDRRSMTEGQLEAYTSPIQEMAKAELKKKKIAYPAGVKVIWSSFHMPAENNMARLYAVRIFQIPGYTARDFVDAMLEGREVTKRGGN